MVFRKTVPVKQALLSIKRLPVGIFCAPVDIFFVGKLRGFLKSNIFSLGRCL